MLPASFAAVAAENGVPQGFPPVGSRKAVTASVMPVRQTGAPEDPTRRLQRLVFERWLRPWRRVIVHLRPVCAGSGLVRDASAAKQGSRRGGFCPASLGSLSVIKQAMAFLVKRAPVLLDTVWPVAKVACPSPARAGCRRSGPDDRTVSGVVAKWLRGGRFRAGAGNVAGVALWITGGERSWRIHPSSGRRRPICGSGQI